MPPAPAPSLARLGSWGVADQAMQSVANILTLVVVARASSPADFGIFALALTAVTFEMTLASAALNQPFAVLAASRRGDDYRRYVTAVLLGHGVFGAIVAAPIALWAAVAYARGWPHLALVLALLPAMLAIQGQDFVRQVLYVEKRIQAALLNDLINYGGLCLGVAALAAAGALTPARGLLMMALMSGLAVLVGLVQLRHSIHWGYSRGDVLIRNRENWRIGRWMLGVAALSVSSTYLTPFVVGAASGAAAAGALRAMVAIMGPVNIVYRTITTALIPAAARAYDAGGLPDLHRLMRRASTAAALSVGTYAALIAVFAAPLLSLVYGDEYAGVAWMMPLIALAHVLGTASSLLDTAVRAQRITDTPFVVSVTNFVMFWAVGAPLIVAFGLRGAAATLVAVPIIALTLQAGRLWREGRRHSALTTLKEA